MDFEPNQNNKFLPLKSIKDIGYLLGHSLSKDECLMMAKEVMDHYSEMEFMDENLLVEYCAKLTEEAKYDPFNCIKDCLKNFNLIHHTNMVKL